MIQHNCARNKILIYIIKYVQKHIILLLAFGFFSKQLFYHTNGLTYNMVICIMLYYKKEHFKHTRLENFLESSKNNDNIFINFNVAYKGYKEFNTIFNKVGLKTAEFFMLNDVTKSDFCYFTYVLVAVFTAVLS